MNEVMILLTILQNMWGGLSLWYCLWCLGPRSTMKALRERSWSRWRTMRTTAHTATRIGRNPTRLQAAGNEGMS